MFIPQPKNPREERSGEVTSTLCFGVADGGGEFFETIRGEGEAATVLSGLSDKGEKMIVLTFVSTSSAFFSLRRTLRSPLRACTSGA